MTQNAEDRATAPAVEPDEAGVIEATVDERPWESAQPGDAWAITMGRNEYAAIVTNGGGFAFRDIGMGATLSLDSPGIRAGRLLFRQERI